MPNKFENKIAGFAKANELFESTSKLLLAVSGGADSTALLYTMQVLKSKNLLRAKLLCAHINHQLRGAEADKDEDFVIAEAAKLKLPVITKQVDVRGFAHSNKLSIETAARQLRIESLLDIAKANDCDCIATAHHKDDNAETVLLRLSRGTGLRGLGGIWPKRNFDGINFTRPFLCVQRDEIIDYLKKHNLKWRDDHTNIDCSYRRNFIRHRLIPALQKQCKNSIAEQLFDLSGSAQRFYSLVCKNTDDVWPDLTNVGSDTVSMNSKGFSAQPQSVKVEIIRRSLVCLGSGEGNMTQQHYEKILQLAKSNVGGRKIELPDGFVIQREYGNLIFTKPKEKPAADKLTSKTVRLNVPGKTKFGHYLIEANILGAEYSMLDARRKRNSRTENRESRIELIERFDLSQVRLPVSIRPRLNGDKFAPLGLREEKKVGKFLTDSKVPQKLRKKTLIVADSEKIIWVCPIRISEQVKITSETKKILQLRIIADSGQRIANRKDTD